MARSLTHKRVKIQYTLKICSHKNPICRHQNNNITSFYHTSRYHPNNTPSLIILFSNPFPKQPITNTHTETNHKSSKHVIMQLELPRASLRHPAHPWGKDDDQNPILQAPPSRRGRDRMRAPQKPRTCRLHTRRSHRSRHHRRIESQSSIPLSEGSRRYAQMYRGMSGCPSHAPRRS